MEDLGISSRCYSRCNICNSSTSAQVCTKRNFIVISGSKKNSTGVKSSAEVRVRGFTRGAGEKRAGVSQPHFGLSVRVKPTLPKVGSWSPTGLSKTQSAIAGVKSLCI